MIKKRATASKSEIASWQLNDLLFISSYGEGESRQISLAHFSEDQQMGDLPTLRVLGWDGDDRDLKLDHVAHELHEKLCWPDDEDNPAAWRNQWSSAFTLRHREVITTSQRLAVRLADLASSIRRKVNAALAIEAERGPLRRLMHAFREALIHDLTEDDFADMYAQTIAYGLLSARVARQSGALVADDVALMVPVTNPFLRELMETFLKVGGRNKPGPNGAHIDFDELGINEVVELLRDAKMEAVLRDFDNRNPQEDPVIHFYELFLKEYDAKKRMQRGVFYTPKPVVSYIVRSVHELLQTEFGLEHGLADTTTWGEMASRFAPSPSQGSQGEGRGEGSSDFKIPDGASPDQAFVQILDPATGTATFLVEVIDVIHRHLKSKWDEGGADAVPKIANQKSQIANEFAAYWNQYVPQCLLPRLHGYELMMAPYAIAHMKIGLKLGETRYRFGSDERVRVYLTNALEPPPPKDQQLTFADWSPALAHEAQAVNAIKCRQRFTVLIGNPPYSVLSANLSETARRIVDQYRFVDGKKIEERSMLRLEMHLQDDYVKFLAIAQNAIAQSGRGLLGLITNNGYLDNLTLRGVRCSIVDQFDSLSILNLHRSRMRQGRKDAEWGDQNVFDIEQGVAIATGCVPLKANVEPGRVGYAELVGSRSKKYETLLNETFTSIDLSPIDPQSPNYFLVPRDDSMWPEYECYVPITSVMPVNISGIVTAHDQLVVEFDDDRLIENGRVLRDPVLSDENARQFLHVKDNAGWKLAKARAEMKKTKGHKQFLKPYAYRPFDVRRIYYHTAIVWCDRRKVMTHVLSGNNVALATCRQLAQQPWEHVLVTRFLQDDCYVSNRTRERSYHFPLNLIGSGKQRGAQLDLLMGNGEHQPNFSVSFVRTLATHLDLPSDGQFGFPQAVSPQSVFDYLYAVLHSPTYRDRYAEFLKIDFPRLPLTGHLALFRDLARIGGDLVALHLMESPKLEKHITKFIGSGAPQVEKVSYAKETVWIDKAKTQGFRGVPENVWHFHIGSYQVCQKWLKDRGPKKGNPGRVLSADDINHYHHIVVALHETIRLMAEIDEVINQHGGWPGAFVTEPIEAGDEEPSPPFA